MGRDRSPRRYCGKFIRAMVQTITNRAEHRASGDPNTGITAARIDRRTNAPTTATSKENCPATQRFK